jgi:hypothetical protein
LADTSGKSMFPGLGSAIPAPNQAHQPALLSPSAKIVRRVGGKTIVVFGVLQVAPLQLSRRPAMRKPPVKWLSERSRSLPWASASVC